MRTAVKVFTFSALFSGVVALVYWLLSSEDAGSVLLLFMFFAPAFIGGYLAVRGWRLRAGEDRPDADYKSEAGEGVGRFHVGSVWPLLMGIGVGVALQGFIFGSWLIVAGAALFVLAAVGLMQESRG